jgi:hypothetical protein
MYAPPPSLKNEIVVHKNSNIFMFSILLSVMQLLQQDEEKLKRVNHEDGKEEKLAFR